MDKETLGQYLSLKKEIKKLERDISRLKEKMVPIVSGKVRGSSREFPYIEQSFKVEMEDPVEADRLRKLEMVKRRRLELAQSQRLAIEEFVAGIDRSDIRMIFEMIFIEGKKQNEVAKILNMDRSSISKKINRYLQLSHNSHFPVL